MGEVKQELQKQYVYFCQQATLKSEKARNAFSVCNVCIEFLQKNIYSFSQMMPGGF